MKILSDVVGDLIERGYVLNFDSLGQVTFELNSDKAEQLPEADFSIDEVYRCRESEDDPDIIYVFAITSVKYNMRGVVVNMLTSESTLTLSEILHTIKERLATWWPYVKKNKNERHGISNVCHDIH